ncbi:hypothetical protein, partial [Pseudomonas corrugata]|uniref:hypothetical protein n=1 Tax=Pseudomonas corrugata TaxID=47879 RepID=UPI001E2EDF6F
MITPTSALIVVPLLSGRPRARQKTTSHAGNQRGLLYELWPGEPTEGRAVYLNEADKQHLRRPSVMRCKKRDFLTKKSAPCHSWITTYFDQEVKFPSYKNPYNFSAVPTTCFLS